MSPDNEKEIMDRVRRIETRLVDGFRAQGVNLWEIALKSKPEAKDTPPIGKHVEVYSLDVPVGRIQTAIRQAWPSHAEPVPVYFGGRMISAVMP